jgi:hypothetical protein
LSPYNGFISRARLIQSALATGALVACRGGVNANPFTTGDLQPTSASLAKNPVDRLRIVNEIFANDVFRHLDKQKMLERFDPTPHLDALREVYFKPSGQQVQLSKVIRSIPSNGIVITAPGKYTLGGDIK